jgi:serine/threonine protein kinase
VSLIGTSLGHYKIVRSLGRGGMGEVYLAEDLRLERRVAVKVLRPELARDSEFLQRFEREARAAAALNHPNIVTVYSVEEDNGVSFLTLELLDGLTLADVIQPDGLPLERILDIAIPLADAIDAAHERDIVHRDLKPTNVMVMSDGRVKVLDFGLAKLLEPRQPSTSTSTTVTGSPTGAGRILGTVDYMSPEQAEARPVDGRSDIFSLGVLLYQMATGLNPFKGDTTISTLSAILKDAPPPVDEVREGITHDFARVVSRCLEKDPDDRYQSAKNLQNDLRSLRDDAKSGELAFPPARRRSVAALASVAAVTVIVLGGGLAVWSRKLSPATGGTSPQASMTVTRLTSSGSAGVATISSDGHYVAFSTARAGEQSLWVRQVSTANSMPLVPPQDLAYVSATFSPDGDYVYSVVYERATRYSSLSRVPVLGGVPRKILDHINSAPTFSPDGKQLAFIREMPDGRSLLVRAPVDGGDVTVIATRADPLGFQILDQTVAWAPKGGSIAAIATDRTTLLDQIVLVDVTTGEQHGIGPKWRQLNALAWQGDGGALFANTQAVEGDSALQLWMVDVPSGSVRHLTNDLGEYHGVAASRDGRALVTVRQDVRTSIWTLSSARPDDAHQVAIDAGSDDGAHGLAWAGDGRLVYAANTGGNEDIWSMNADGSGRVQLTTSRAEDILPRVTPNGRFVVFVSERDGGRGIWRMDISGGGEVRLSPEQIIPTPMGPNLSFDGSEVCFTTLQRVNLTVPVAGGEGIPLFGAPREADSSRLPAGFHDPQPSPDDLLIMGHYQTPEGSERMATVSAADPSHAKLWPDVPNNARWSIDGRALVYYVNTRGVGNLWKQPLSGEPPTQLTHFNEAQIFYFAMSSDGSRLAIVRGTTVSDVVLMTNAAVANR